MRKRLLGTSALMAFGMLSPGAHAADKIRLTLGGYFDAFLVAGRQDDGAGQSAAGFRNHGIGRESEIFFRGTTALDNGIRFGVNIQLEGETSADQIDESYIFAEGRFGRIELGSEDPAGDSMFVGPDSPIDGGGINSPIIVHIQNGGNAIRAPATLVNISGDNDKISYFSPRIAGLQFGASYTPDATQERAGALRARNDAGQQSESLEAALNYERALGRLGIRVTGSIARADLEGPAAGTREREQWGLSTMLTYRGVEFGASYRQDNQGTSGGNSDRRDIAAGLNYGEGAWSVGVEYALGEAEAGAAGGRDRSEGLELGAVYDLGPGINVTGGVQFWRLRDNLNAPASENDATIVIIGTNLSF